MYSQVAANKRKTVLLIVVFIVFIGLFGWLLSQIQSNSLYLAMVLGFALIYSWFSYYNSAKIALFMSGAKAVDKKQAPQLYRIVENLTITANLPMPKIYIIEDEAPNAFASGRKPQQAVVAVTTGLIEIMEDEELEGVLAHELSHIGNYDIRVMGMVLMLVTIMVYLSDFVLRMAFWGGLDDDNNGGRNPVMIAIGLAAALVAPIAAMLLQLAVSRKREFLADASGALLTRYPDGLASALKKIEQYPKPMRHASSATAHLFISNPLKGKKASSWFATLFSTHPPVDERVKRLHDMGDNL